MVVLTQEEYDTLVKGCDSIYGQRLYLAIVSPQKKNNKSYIV